MSASCSDLKAIIQSMASNQKLESEIEIISLAIQRLMEEEKMKKASDRSSDDTDSDLLLLSRLLTQVESMEENKVIKHSSKQENEERISTSAMEAEELKVEKTEELILKELKEVKKQNLITHCLVSAMIILTIAWQLSEVSIILKVKDGLTNPFKFLGRMLKKKTTVIQNQIESAELPHLNMPHVSLPDFDFNDK